MSTQDCSPNCCAWPWWKWQVRIPAFELCLNVRSVLSFYASGGSSTLLRTFKKLHMNTSSAKEMYFKMQNKGFSCLDKWGRIAVMPGKFQPCTCSCLLIQTSKTIFSSRYSPDDELMDMTKSFQISLTTVQTLHLSSLTEKSNLSFTAE